ncbi:MAG: AAA family ATPase [bacterium]|nr:AAA family ATPase [bacterium]
MPESTIFVGREDERRTIHRLIAGREKAVICVKGRSKMGKTHLALKLLEELNEKPNTFCGFYRAEGPSKDPVYPFLDILRQILQAYDKKESAEKVERTIGQAFGSAVRERAGELVGAVVQDAMGSLFKQLTKHLDLSKTSETLGNILSDASDTWTTSAELSTMLAEHRPDVVRAFLQHCRSLAEAAASEDHFVFLFDQVEHESDGFWNFLMALARNLPERFYTVFTLNDEHDRGREFWQRHGAELAGEGTEEVDLPEFTLPELKTLIAAYSKPPKADATLEAARRVTGGRPYLLDSWIRSEDYDKNVVPEDDDRFKEYHRQRLFTCSEEARRMAKALALLPDALPGGLEDYRTCFGKESLDEVEELFGSLVSNRVFRRLPGKTWFVHEEMQDYVRENTDNEVKRELAEVIIRGILDMYPESSEEFSLYGLALAMLMCWTTNHEETLSLNLRWARHCLNRGDLISSRFFYQNACNAVTLLGDREQEITILDEMSQVLESLHELNDDRDFYYQKHHLYSAPQAKEWLE